MSLLDDITKRGAEIRERLHNLLCRHGYPHNIKTFVLAAYVDVAREHHAAIWLLRKSDLIGSAIALVRSVVDTMLRALWINAVATEEQIKQAWLDELKVPMREMREQIQQAYFGTQSQKDPELAKIVEKFFELLTQAWHILSSYTHSGGRQISRRFTGDQVKPSYTEHETAQVLNVATVALLLLLRMFFVSMNYKEEADETKTMLEQYFLEFNQRLQGGQ